MPSLCGALQMAAYTLPPSRALAVTARFSPSSQFRTAELVTHAPQSLWPGDKIFFSVVERQAGGGQSYLSLRTKAAGFGSRTRRREASSVRFPLSSHRRREASIAKKISRELDLPLLDGSVTTQDLRDPAALLDHISYEYTRSPPPQSRADGTPKLPSFVLQLLDTHYQLRELLPPDAPPPMEKIGIRPKIQPRLRKGQRPPMPNPLVLDFQKTYLSVVHRREVDRTPPLLRAAVLGKQEDGPCRILDATAGLGRDAFQLARAGAEVILLERNPIVFLLLQEALERARNGTVAHVQEITSRMQAHHLDSIDVLQDWERYQLGPRPHVIHLDPMYPSAKPSFSLPQYGMQVARYMRKLLRKDDVGWEESLLPLARQVALKRVVVKRPKTAPQKEGVGITYRSRQTRYDIYLRQPSTPNST
eukprot:CAMPEP_0177682710 /NCGR_PEP_ID=MMETSP0447-20121125/31399_1 /TAXON_ID=0 /ORGANISM="Stygamoeba regulata, Strain BSH-02190019" /LENGTH=418 /DNA_ID=CAMNT_0019192221 /DNA_START=155 /DNA_END=1411 /DNA_ORIENTATION=+